MHAQHPAPSPSMLSAIRTSSALSNFALDHIGYGSLRKEDVAHAAAALGGSDVECCHVI